MSDELRSVVITIIKFLTSLILVSIIGGAIIIFSVVFKAQSVASKAADATALIAQENGTITYSDYCTLWKAVKLYEPANTLPTSLHSFNAYTYVNPWESDTSENRKMKHWVNIDSLSVYKTEDYNKFLNKELDKSQLSNLINTGKTGANTDNPESNDYSSNMVVQRGTAIIAVVEVSVNIKMPVNWTYSDGSLMWGNDDKNGKAKGVITLNVSSGTAQTISIKYYKGLSD